MYVETDAQLCAFRFLARLIAEQPRHQPNPSQANQQRKKEHNHNATLSCGSKRQPKSSSREKHHLDRTPTQKQILAQDMMGSLASDHAQAMPYNTKMTVTKGINVSAYGGSAVGASARHEISGGDGHGHVHVRSLGGCGRAQTFSTGR